MGINFVFSNLLGATNGGQSALEAFVKLRAYRIVQYLFVEKAGV